MKATDWLDEAVQQTKEKYQVERALEDELIQEEALKATLASKFCAELFAWLETIDVKFNTRFGGQVLAVSPINGKGHSGLQVLAQPSRAQERFAELNYQGDINCLALSMSSGATANTQIIKMVRSAGGGILAEIGGEHYTPEQLGQKLINDLLGIGFTPSESRSQSSELPCCSVSSNNIEMLHQTIVAGRSNGGCTVALG